MAINKEQLILKDVSDDYVRENFSRLQRSIDSLTDNANSSSDTSTSSSTSTINSMSSQFGIENIGIKATLSGGIKVEITDGSGNPISSSSQGKISFRHKTLKTGQIVQQSIASPLVETVPGGATLGFAASESNKIFVYLIDNDGDIKIGFSSTDNFNEGKLHTTTNLSSGSTAHSVLYSSPAITTARPIRNVGVITITRGASSWDTAPAAVEVYSGQIPFYDEIIHSHYKTNANQLITNNVTTTVIFEDVVVDSHSAVTQSGNYPFVAPRDGVYSITASIRIASYTAARIRGTISYTANSISFDSFGEGINMSIIVKLLKGNSVTFTILQNSGSNKNLDADAVFNHFMITSLPGFLV